MDFENRNKDIQQQKQTTGQIDLETTLMAVLHLYSKKAKSNLIGSSEAYGFLVGKIDDCIQAMENTENVTVTEIKTFLTNALNSAEDIFIEKLITPYGGCN